MKKSLLSTVLLLALNANLVAKADLELVKSYLDISGTAQTIESLSTQVTMGIEQTSAIYGKRADQKRIAKLQKIFAPQASLESVQKVMVKKFDNPTLKKIIKFYHTNSAEEITQANLDALAPDAQTQMLHYIADLRENPPSKERVKVINHFIDALDMDAVMNDLFFEMFDYLNTQAPKSQRLSLKKRDRFMKMLERSFEQQMFLNTLFVYRDVSNADLKKVTKYFQSKVGEKEKHVVREAMRTMLKEGFKRAL